MMHDNFGQETLLFAFSSEGNSSPAIWDSLLKLKGSNWSNSKKI
jgi:hypothetical protein